VVIDAVRCAKLALDRDISGTLEGPSAYFMKSPAIQHPDEVARELVEAFIRDEAPSEAAAGNDITPSRRRKKDEAAASAADAAPASAADD
jgi:myo-inositol-1-phosphate synthase